MFIFNYNIKLVYAISEKNVKIRITGRKQFKINLIIWCTHVYSDASGRGLLFNSQVPTLTYDRRSIIPWKSKL